MVIDIKITNGLAALYSALYTNKIIIEKIINNRNFWSFIEQELFFDSINISIKIIAIKLWIKEPIKLPTSPDTIAHLLFVISRNIKGYNSIFKQYFIFWIIIFTYLVYINNATSTCLYKSFI